MRTLLISAGIGIAAGIIDIAPMVARRMDTRSILSAFAHYVVVSIVIVNIDLPGVAWWLQGSLIALAMAVPIMIIVSGSEKKALPVIAAMAVILGAGIGLAGHYLR